MCGVESVEIWGESGDELVSDLDEYVQMVRLEVINVVIDEEGEFGVNIVVDVDE